MVTPFTISSHGLAMCIVVSLMTYEVRTVGESVTVRFETVSNKTLKNKLFYYDGFSASKQQCAAVCASDEICQTASYYDKDGTCRLSKYNGADPGTQQSKTLWTLLMKAGTGACEGHWIKIEDSCYLFNLDENNYLAHKSYCESERGKLAEPQTEAEFDRLRFYMVDNYGQINFWIGLTDEAEEGKFVWNSNGLETSYTAWSSEPYISDQYNCVNLFRLVSYKWDLAPCDVGKYGAVCEKV